MTAAIPEFRARSPVAPLREGDALADGSINQSGSFLMRAEKVGAATTLKRIIAMVVEAQRSQTSIQKLADRASG